MGKGTQKKSTDFRQSIYYWKCRLDGCSSVLTFPYDYPRINISSGHRGREPIHFSSELSSELRQISKHEGISLFSAMLTTFGILMHKYSGDHDINIGIPVANRSHSSMGSIIGRIVNTVVIRLKFDQKISFRNLLKTINKTISETIAHQDISFEKIVEIVNPERTANMNPVFQVAFTWDDNLSIPHKLNGVKSNKVFIPGGASTSDLTCSISDNGEMIEGEIEYNTDLIKKDTIIRLRDNYVNLARNLVSNYEIPIANVPLISEEEKKRVLDFTNTSTPYPGDKTIAQLFEEQIENHSNKTAVVFKQDYLTYDQLNRRSNRLAWKLKEKGIEKNRVVGLLVDKSIDSIVGILGILKAGGAYLPIDTEYPAERINYMIQESNCLVILTQNKYAGLPIQGVEKIYLDSPASYHKDDNNIVNEVTSKDLAYIMYTSGTTGKPKGIMIRQKSVIRLVRNTNYIKLTSEDRILLTGAIVFDATTFEIWGALLNGGSLYIPYQEEILDPNLLGDLLLKYQITTLWLISALFTQIAEIRTDIFGRLKYLLVGGDVLSPPHINKVRKDNPKLTVINGYGPTENTTFATCYHIESDFDHNIPIGKPISNTTVYIFDKYLNLQPIGVIGEIYLGGEGLSNGYLNRDELSKVSFIENPDLSEERLYRTGDYGKWLADGNIEFHGRIDNQIKIRGFRVEIEEIESIISNIKGVINAVVKPFRITKSDLRLVAFLNVTEKFRMGSTAVKDLLKEKIPSYMVPSIIKIMHGFPLKINGKIDREALVLNENEEEIEQSNETQFLSFTEEIIYNIWCKILNTKKIDRNDNFFEIGGNSLTAISVLNKINEKLKIRISYKDFIINPTIVRLSKNIDDYYLMNDSSIDLIHLKYTDDLPLTQSQTRIWLATRLNPAGISYNLPFAYHLTGPLNIDNFQRSIKVLFSRHLALFSTIVEKNGAAYCTIKYTGIHAEIIDYRENPLNERESSVLEFINRDSRRVFDLVNGPLFRLFLFRISDEEYYFYFVIHHIIFDGWSWKVFINDLKQTYNDLQANKEISLRKPEYQQYDFALWEKNSILSKNIDKSVIFWKSMLKDCSPFLNFPFDFPRSKNSSGFGERELIEFSETLSVKLRQISKNEGISLFSVMLCTFGILMHKYSGDYDINIGTFIANRSHSSFERIIGMFINTVIIRLKLDEDISFKNLLKRTSEVILDAITHQDLPLEKVVEIVNPDRIANTNPVFQVSFAWEDNLHIPLEMNGIKSNTVFIHSGGAPFDLTCYMWDNGDTISGEIEYNIDLIRPDTIIGLRDNYLNLVNELVSNFSSPIGSVSCISETEKRKLEEFNNTETSIPDCLVQGFFENQVMLTPLKKAITCGEESLTYKELDNRANQLAKYLISMGIVPGDVVGICLERSVEMVVSVLGILKSGSSYLPLDSSFPDERLSYMFGDSGAKALITQDSCKNKVKHCSNTLIVIVDKERDELLRYNNDKPAIMLSAQAQAYIIYTSGSTGMPKGVKIHHQAVVNLLNSVRKKPGFKETDKLLAVTTLSFDISVLELFLPLSFGGELVIASTIEIADGQKLSELLEQYDITVMQGTPATWNVLLGCGWKGKKNLKALCGGEALTLNIAGQLFLRVRELWNLYGPTETTIWSTCCQITDTNFPILIGKPIDNTRIHILDKNNKQLPVGVKGELCIGGLGVAKGYNNRPELIAEKFILFDNDQIIYKTGDQGRYLQNGNIELFGRIDNQIKLRGFRIEPGEIETLLLNIRGVIESVVKAHTFEEDDNRLVAFLHVDNEFELTNDAIIRTLSQQLPKYMIPSFYQKCDGFPRMPNGKINRKALHFEIEKSKQKDKESIDAFSETHRKLITIWESILRINNITGTDNFFEIGGNSFLAIRVVNKINEEIGFTLLFNELLINPTINQLCSYIDSQEQRSQNAINLVHLNDISDLPLSLNQKRIWLVSKLQPDLPTYIIPITYEIDGPLNRNIFQHSLELLFQRHHVLFSVIKEFNDEPYCDIAPGEVKIDYIDYSELSEKERKNRIIEFIDSESIRIFDLRNGPLYRLYLINSGNNKYFFHLSIHHIIFDGWSWTVFANDLSEIYNSLKEGRKILLKDLKYQQYDFASWELRTGHINYDETLINFWRETLKDVSPVLNFPYDFLRKAYSSGRGGHEHIQLTCELSDKFRNISKEENSSLFVSMLSIYAIMLHKYSGEEDICIGSPIASRQHSDLENIIGMFVNTLVIRLKFERDYTCREFIRITQRTLLEALAHQDLPFENVVEIVNPVRSVNINPLFQVSFAWQNNLNVPLTIDGVKSNYITGQEGTSVFDMTMFMWESGDIIEGYIEYNSDLLKRETITRFKNNFSALAERLAENYDIPLSSIPVMSAEEQRLVLGYTGTQVPYPKDKTIVQLFEEQVRNNPCKVAVVFKESSLKYSELNERTNQLARTLRNLGVKRDTPVGVFADKSIEMIVGILGILKAGGAYLPFDPEYPNQRVNFIIIESGCRVLLTQKKYIEVPIKGVTKLDLNSPGSYNRGKENIESINSSSDLAYIMYTSGTSGVPKGSMIRQYSVVRLVRNTNYIKLSPEDRILLTGAIVFDATTFEIWGSLLNGATLHIVEKETILNPKAFREELIKNEITVLWLTSSLFTQIAEVRTDIFSKLKYLLVGGDVLSVPHVNKVRKDNPHLKVINGYGPTENTTFSTTFLIEKDFEHNIPIGKPVSNSTLNIFDKYLNYSPIGVEGEIYVGGDGLSRGYLNREDMDRSAFIDHPYKPGERLYRTGDYGRWLPDGNIEFHGRVDNQIKIRGFRVEMEEIESVISEIEGVIETVVKPLKTGDGNYKLIAFLNVPNTFKMSTKEIEGRIRATLPLYMVPAEYRLIHGFPKTLNGKTDRNALRFDIKELERKEIQDLESLTPIERKIYNIWCATLKTKEILTTDNFFEIGGNSLLAISILSRIESEFKLGLSLKNLFDYPRIRDISEFIGYSTNKFVKAKSEEQKGRNKSKIIKGSV